MPNSPKRARYMKKAELRQSLTQILAKTEKDKQLHDILLALENCVKTQGEELKGEIKWIDKNHNILALAKLCSSKINKLLEEHMVRPGLLPHVKVSRKEGGTFWPYWIEPEVKVKSNHVLWCRVGHYSEYLDLELLGAFSMARELKVELEVHYVRAKAVIPTTEELRTSITEIGNRKDLDPATTTIIVRHYWPVDPTDYTALLPTYHVITSTDDGGLPHCKDVLIGKGLAVYALECFSHNKQVKGREVETRPLKTAIILSPTFASGASLLGARREEAFLGAMSGKDVRIFREHFGATDTPADEIRRARDAVLTALKKKVFRHPAVIFATSVDATVGAVEALTATKVSSDNVAVLSANITCSTLALMLQGHGFLQAFCSVEPYYLGRLAMRHAAARSVCEPVAPILIRRQEVVDIDPPVYDVLSLVERFSQLRLEKYYG